MNVERRQMVRAAVAHAQSNGDEITLENVAQYLPGGVNVLPRWTGDEYSESFSLDAEDLESFAPQNAMIDSTPDGRELIPIQSIPAELVSEPIEDRADDVSTNAGSESSDPGDAAPSGGRVLQPPEAEPFGGRVLQPPKAEPVCEPQPPTQYELGELRITLARAKDRQTTARAKYSIAVERYQRAAGTRPPTFNELVHDNARANNQYLHDIKNGVVPAPVNRSRVGASVIDQTAAAYRGSGMRAGGGKAYARGAYPATMRGQKLPSEK